MISTLITVLIVLIIVIAVCYGCFWIIDSSFPEPIRWVAKLVVGVIGLIALLYLLQGDFGTVLH